MTATIRLPKQFQSAFELQPAITDSEIECLEKLREVKGESLWIDAIKSVVNARRLNVKDFRLLLDSLKSQGQDNPEILVRIVGLEAFCLIMFNDYRRILHKVRLSSTKLYFIWRSMRQRCADKYRLRYGGRGIKVCERWENSFLAFIVDMGGDYIDGLSIERIDNDGDYTPQNCKWVTRAEQAKNTSRSNKVTINGETKILADWCKQFGIDYGTARARIQKGILGGADVFKIKPVKGNRYGASLVNSKA